MIGDPVERSPVAAKLLAWYDRHARKLPWRVGPKERARRVKPDPYRVWLSEIMLQQTSVAAVKPHFEAFVARWPTVASLAAASRDDVMKAWAGLGYYARARNLKACAEAVVASHAGRFPSTSAGLRTLPGIGDYTASAVAAIAFDEPAAVVDGNVERVIARLFGIATPLPAAKKEIRERQAGLTPRRRAGDYAQAMMDLGATICTPRRPACSFCPINDGCMARAQGDAETYPRRAAETKRPTRYGAAFVAIRDDGAILLRRRGESGLLGAMAEVPGTDWSPDFARDTAISRAPLAREWRAIGTPVVHVFTHFRLVLDVYTALASRDVGAPPGCWWEPAATIPDEALPSVMKKAIEAAIPGATKRRPRRPAA